MSQEIKLCHFGSPISMKKVMPRSPEFTPGHHLVSSPVSSSYYSSFASRSSWGARGDSPKGGGGSPKATPHSSPPPELATSATSASIHQENVGGTTYFYHASSNNTTTESVNSSLNSSAPFTNSHGSLRDTSFTVYPGPAPHVVSSAPRSALAAAFFMPEELRQELLAKQNAELHDLHDQGQDLPSEVDNYHSLVLLEPPGTTVITHKGNFPASTYRAVNTTTGSRYCLRRLHGYRLPNTKCMVLVDMWKKLEHTNIVQLREVFTTKGFGDNSMVFVYDYHPNSQTLLAKYFLTSASSGSEQNGYAERFQGDARPYSHKSVNRSGNTMPPETEIWAIIMQLTAALRAIHSVGLACRTLDPTKVLITGHRVRLSCLGITDILTFDSNATNPLAHVTHYQQDDLTALGKLVVALACGSLVAVHRDHMQSSLEVVARAYSTDLRNLIMYLLSPQQRRTVTDLMPMIGARFYTQLDAIQSRADALEDNLAREMENGRLYRLLVKLGTVNERPELHMDSTWSETGDRYMLKLYRDYLFHSVTEDGRPWLDQAHIVNSLNKLDSGVNEKVQLMSRDEQSVLVVTYAELKHCLEQAFEEVIIATT